MNCSIDLELLMDPLIHLRVNIEGIEKPPPSRVALGIGRYTRVFLIRFNHVGPLVLSCLGVLFYAVIYS